MKVTFQDFDYYKEHRKLMLKALFIIVFFAIIFLVSMYVNEPSEGGVVKNVIIPMLIVSTLIILRFRLRIKYHITEIFIDGQVLTITYFRRGVLKQVSSTIKDFYFKKRFFDQADNLAIATPCLKVVNRKAKIKIIQFSRADWTNDDIDEVLDKLKAQGAKVENIPGLIYWKF